MPSEQPSSARDAVYSFECVTEPEQLVVLKDQVVAAAERHGATETCLMNVLLVLDEILANISMHAYKHKVEPVRVEFFPPVPPCSALHLVFHDWGPEFNPAAFEVKSPFDTPLEERDIGGLGLYLIREIPCEMQYERIEADGPDKACNRLTIAVPLCPAQSGQPGGADE